MVTLEQARRIIAAAGRKSKDLGQPMNIAVADSGGNLVAHDDLRRRRPAQPSREGGRSRRCEGGSGEQDQAVVMVPN